jgi:hypothetical protein
MSEDHTPSYWDYRRLYAYVIPPALAFYGLYSAIKMEMNVGDFHVKGPMAILAGLGLVVLAAGVLALLYYRDKWYKRGRFD